MITSVLLPYVVIVIILCIVINILTTSMNVVWTLLMSSYNLSLPGLLWGGGKFNFPTFIPPDQNSPLAFYYWFFVVAVVMFAVFVALNAFRHLSFWAKFDNEVEAYEQTNFWHQFKWIIILMIMTLLTPILIWVCYSIFMMGVYFFMGLVGSDSMFVTISEEDFNTLKSKYMDDLNKIISMDSNSVINAIKLVLSDSTAKANLLEKLQSEAGLSESAAKLYITALETIRDKLPEQITKIKLAAASLYSTLKQKSYSDPIGLSDLTTFKNTLNGLIMNYNFDLIDASSLSGNFSSWSAWMKIFGNSATSSSTLNFKNLMAYAYYDKATLPTAISNLINAWENPTSGSVFYALGYGYGSSMQTMHAQTIVAERLCGRQMYIISTGKQYTYTFLTFKNGFEVGLRTCPLTKYINYAVTNSYLPFDQQFESTLGITIAGFILAVSGDIMKSINISPGTNTPLVYAGWGLVIVGFMYMLPSLMSIVQAVVYILCWRLMIKPLLGLVFFIWTAFIESMWYFFLLLPAIGASVGDTKHQVWKEAWKNCIGRAASVLILWSAILLMFAALYQLDNLYLQIWEGVKTMSGDWDGTTSFTIILFGDSLGSTESFFYQLVSQIGAHLVMSLALTLNWCGIIEFALVLIILRATYKIITQIGEIAFTGVYKELPTFQSKPLNALLPGFSEGSAAIRGAGARAWGVGQSIGKQAGRANEAIKSKEYDPKTDKWQKAGEGAKEQQWQRERRAMRYDRDKTIDAINSANGKSAGTSKSKGSKNQFGAAQEQKIKTASAKKS